MILRQLKKKKWNVSFSYSTELWVLLFPIVSIQKKSLYRAGDFIAKFLTNNHNIFFLALVKGREDQHSCSLRIVMLCEFWNVKKNKGERKKERKGNLFYFM